VLLPIATKKELLAGLVGQGHSTIKGKGGGKAPSLSPEEGQSRSRRLMEALPEALDPDSFQVGRTKVFFRKAGVDEMERRRQGVLRGSAVRAQATVRMHLAVRRYARSKAACASLQRLARGFIARRAVRQMRRNIAAVKMEAFARRLVARNKFRRYRFAVTLLQSRSRTRTQVARFSVLRREHYATKITAFRKRRVQERKFRAMRAAAISIQCAARQRHARARLARL